MILGRRVRLRAVEREDLPRFVAWLNHPEVRRGPAQSFPLSLPLEEPWFEKTLAQEPHERPFSIDARRAGGWLHIGSCGPFRFDRKAHSAELGILIGDRGYWNRGYGKEGTGALPGHAFDTLNLHRVALRVYARTPSPSRRTKRRDSCWRAGCARIPSPPAPTRTPW